MKGTPFKIKQKLSPVAKRAKAVRDKKAAMTEWGKFKKRTAQKAGCKAGFDFDHDLGRCIPKSKNRAKNSRSGSTRKKYNY
jgi:hypothetical protein|tara:strand:- start:568 stop:810 length:243 start_codon:yes stop_codon:yes gene_type:complete